MRPTLNSPGLSLSVGLGVATHGVAYRGVTPYDPKGLASKFAAPGLFENDGFNSSILANAGLFHR
jgi:hypothetical protein